MQKYYSRWEMLSARLKSGILYWLLTLLVVILYAQDLPWLHNLELKLEDQIRSSRALEPDLSKIAVVAVDAKSIEEVGDWPWDHGRISDLLITICDYKPKAVMLDFPLGERVEEFSSGNSGTLAESMRDCGNIVLPFDIVVSDEGGASRPAPDYFHFSSLMPTKDVAIDELPRVVAAFVPPQVFAQNVAAVGFRYFDTDLDDKVRSLNTIVNFEDKIFIAAPVQLANLYLNGREGSFTFDGSGKLLMNSLALPTDDEGRLLVNLPAAGKAYQLVSAIDVLTGDADPATVRGKAVIVAATQPGDFEFVETAIAGNLPSYQFYAATAQNLIDGAAPKRLDFFIPLDLLLILLIGAFGGLMLPRMGQIYRIAALLIIGIVLFNVNYVLFDSLNGVMNVIYPTIAVVFFIIASVAVRPHREPQTTKSVSKTYDLKKLLGDEPIATKRDTGQVFSFDEIPAGMMREEAAPEVFSETIRLDYEALRKGGDLVSEETIRRATSKLRTSDVEKTVQDVRKDVAAAEANDTKTFIPDLLDVDISKIPSVAPPDKPAPKSKANVDDEIILTDEEKKIYGVRFSNDGQPVSFGRYQVIEPLGKGAMGTVYKGKDPAIDRLVALKTIRLDAIADPSEIQELRERLNREAKAAGNLSHPNIVTIYDVGMQGNLQYIAMEYIEGYTLESVLKRNLQLNYRILATIIIQVCSALDYAHKMGIVHRDIKPANIMVMEGFKVKVMDFGIAHFESSSMTQTGVAMGTPNYISPEQLRGKDVTPSSDIFSLGVVLYEMLTHRRPFTGDNISQLVYKILNEDPPAPTDLDPKVPPLFDLILKKSLAKDPNDRYRSAKDFAAAMQDFTVTFAKKSAAV